MVWRTVTGNQGNSQDVTGKQQNQNQSSANPAAAWPVMVAAENEIESCNDSEERRDSDGGVKHGHCAFKREKFMR